MELTQKKGIGLNLFLFATPVLTGLTVAISPANAATIAGAVAIGGIGHLSQEPIATQQKTDTDTFVGVGNGIAAGLALGLSAYGDLPFYPDDDTDPIGFTGAGALAVGEGNSYVGLAASTAKLVGGFAVAANETFSFDFKLLIGLLAGAENPIQEAAFAVGKVSFTLIDACRNIILDTFSIFGGLSAQGQPFGGGYWSSNFHPTQIDFGFLPAGDLSLAGGFVAGSYSRTFNQATHLKLVQISQAGALVAADAEAVPEPATILGSAFFVGFLGLGRKLKHKLSVVKSRLTELSH